LSGGLLPTRFGTTCSSKGQHTMMTFCNNSIQDGASELWI
jgi:hypothetical protein